MSVVFRVSVSLSNLVFGIFGDSVLRSFQIIGLDVFKIGFAWRIFFLDRDECRETAGGFRRGQGAARGGAEDCVSLSNLVFGISADFREHSFRIIGLRVFKIGFASRIFFLDRGECREMAEGNKIGRGGAARAVARGGDRRLGEGVRIHYICIARMGVGCQGGPSTL
jgi:hypothetical protein